LLLTLKPDKVQKGRLKKMNPETMMKTLIVLIVGLCCWLLWVAHETDSYRELKDRKGTIQMHPYPTAPR